MPDDESDTKISPLNIIDKSNPHDEAADDDSCDHVSFGILIQRGSPMVQWSSTSATRVHTPDPEKNGSQVHHLNTSHN